MLLALLLMILIGDTLGTHVTWTSELDKNCVWKGLSSNSDLFLKQASNWGALMSGGSVLKNFYYFCRAGRFDSQHSSA